MKIDITQTGHSSHEAVDRDGDTVSMHARQDQAIETVVNVGGGEVRTSQILRVTVRDPDPDPSAPDPGPEPTPEPDGSFIADTLTPSNTGAQADPSDLQPSGRLVTSRNGQHIEDLYVTGDGSANAHLVIAHSGVTIDRLHIRSTGRASAIRIERDLEDIRIGQVTIDGTKAQYGTNRADANSGNIGIKAWSPFTVDSFHIYDCRQAIQLWSRATAATLRRGIIGDVWRPASGVSTSGISYRGSNDTAEECLVEDVLVETAAMSGLGISARDAPVRNLLARRILVRGIQGGQGRQTQYGVRGGYQGSHRGGNRDVRFEDIRFAGSFQWGTNGAVNVGQPGNTWDASQAGVAVPPKVTL